MQQQIFFVAGHIDHDQGRDDFRIGGFVQTGTLQQAQQYIAEKQRTSQNKLRLYQLTEMEV